jgi:anti-anti-sigma regulatory factor
MELTLQPSDDDLVRVVCAGQVMQYLIPAGPHPLEKLIGPDAFKRRILFSLDRTTFIDTSGIAWLLSCHKRCNQAGGRIVYHSAPPLIDDTLKVLRMDRVLFLADNEAAARTKAVGESGG